jgi:REJ domain
VVPLNFTWSCIVSSLTDFGSPCSFGKYLNRHKSAITIPANQLAENYTYSVLVTAKSNDGRYSSQTISVVALQAGVPVVTIPSKRSKFNADEILKLNGLFVANYSLYATWNVSFAGTAVTIAQSALTTITKSFFQAQAVDPTTNYPLAIGPNTFIAGRYNSPSIL